MADGQVAAAPIKQTEMETLCARLSMAASDMSGTNDRIEQSLARFNGEPSPGAPPTDLGARIGPVDPVPGTLACLNMLVDRVATEAARHSTLRKKLGAIL